MSIVALALLIWMAGVIISAAVTLILAPPDEDDLLEGMGTWRI